MKLIGITGYARSGKDTLFESIKRVNKHHDVKRISFADPIKKDIQPFVQEHFGIDAWTEDNKEKSLIRPLLVAYGKAKRELDPDYWLKRGIKQLDEYNNDNIIYVITDVRYENELNAIKERGGSLVHLIKKLNEPANEEELKNEIILSPKCDFTIELPDFKIIHPVELWEKTMEREFDERVKGIYSFGNQ